ncbi:flagellin-like hook-associated protein FlgL [Rhizobium tibeticum]|uniref:flagellin N-terminal helical domain-containing protein n=1 Tax=Rhizobium tibeticum TaxID=501024 RepID=UPI002781AE0A|nr:flagellin-like hook-associated protein FlgL [Rhizobium tibeticum]
MTSLITNTSAAVALQTLRSVNSKLQDTQTRVSTGLRVEKASDNSAYWSIATTMRSDRAAVAAVSDALGLAAAEVDTAYEAMEQTGTVLSQIKAKLAAATENGVDKAKIQDEIAQLVQQTITIANSASFNGVNWLNTDIHDLYEADPKDRSASLVSSFVRNAAGTVKVDMMSLDQIMTSLYNKEGGGILDGDPRSPLTIGGMRGENYVTTDITNDYLADHILSGFAARISNSLPLHITSGQSIPDAMLFSSTDKITFDITLDGDNPSQGLSAPLNPGEPVGVTVNQALVISQLGKASISNATEMSKVLNAAFAGAGIGTDVLATPFWHYPIGAPAYPDPVEYFITTTEQSGLNGSQVQLTNFSSTLNAGTLENANAYGGLGSTMTLDFTPFKIYRDVSLDFTFGVNGEATETQTIDRATINSILGTTDGWINTADDMVTVLKALITRPNTIIEANGSQVLVRSDPLDDRLNGGKTKIGFTNMIVNIEPLPMSGLKAVDVEKNPGMVSAYLASVESMLGRVIDGAATLGSLKNHIEIQTEFANNLFDDISSGIGRLVDADMEEESSRLTALQTQQQLAVQSLSIANSAPGAVLKLFQ